MSLLIRIFLQLFSCASHPFKWRNLRVYEAGDTIPHIVSTLSPFWTAKNGC